MEHISFLPSSEREAQKFLVKHSHALRRRQRGSCGRVIVVCIAPSTRVRERTKPYAEKPTEGWMEMESRQQRGLTGTTEEEEDYFILDHEHHQSQFIMAKSQYGTWKDATHQSNPLHDHESARVILQNEKRAAWERERRGSGYMREQRSLSSPSVYLWKKSVPTIGIVE